MEQKNEGFWFETESFRGQLPSETDLPQTLRELVSQMDKLAKQEILSGLREDGGTRQTVRRFYRFFGFLLIILGWFDGGFVLPSSAKPQR
jgi:hypothetical protein